MRQFTPFTLAEQPYFAELYRWELAATRLPVRLLPKCLEWPNLPVLDTHSLTEPGRS